MKIELEKPTEKEALHFIPITTKPERKPEPVNWLLIVGVVASVWVVTLAIFHITTK